MRYPAILKKFVFTVLMFCSAGLLAQDYQTNYTFGKELFREGRFELAMQSFKRVMLPAPNNPYAAYAGFYHALSAYRLGQLENSRQLFLEVTQRFADWDKIDEAYYWLATGYFEDQKPAAALGYLNRIKSSGMAREVAALKTNYISKIDTVAQLKALYQTYPEDSVVARWLARNIAKDAGNLLDQGMVREIVEKFGFSEEEFGLIDLTKSIKKDEYHVAVMLPFMFSSLDDSKANLRTDFVTDLYMGILLGVEKLKGEGVKVVVHAYDTKRSGPVTEKLLEKEELKRMDLIVGPLYAEPIRLVSEFTVANRINMINPVSANPDVMAGNVYSYLLRPSYLTQSLKAADYAVEKFQNNKNALVFYESNERDSAAAWLYKQKLDEAGFNVVKIKELKASEAHYLIDTLTFKEEVEIRTQKLLDSMQADPEKFVVKSRQKIYGKDSLLYYHELWGIKKDSIGHVMVASSNALFATNIISAVETRPDAIPVIAREEWLEIPQVNFDQVERIGATFISPIFIDKSRYSYSQYAGIYIKKYKSAPSVYASVGYELMVVFGRLMHENGNYFQAGLQDGVRVEGELTPAFEYGYFNDNQVVTFLKLINSELVTEVK